MTEMKTSIAPNSSEGRARRFAGSKFQRVRPEAEKVHAPNLVLIRGTLSLFVLFDRRCFTESAEKRRLDK